MPYQHNPQAPSYWMYDELPIQADIEVHRFAVDFATRSLSAGSRILDVAAGFGALSKSLLDRGFHVSCTTWNSKIKLAIPTYLIDLDRSFSARDVGGGGYQMIFCIEIIEHLENPAQFLRSVADLLAPDGFVVLSTPNVESAQARLEWFVRGCPYVFDGEEITRNRHISIIWRQGLECLASLAGFDIVAKHLLGEFRYANRLQYMLKRPIFELMYLLLRGDLRGNTRLYVLRRTKRVPTKLNATDVA